MSHFPVYVLIPGDPEDLGIRLNKLLAPYDEGLEVQPYEDECECVGYKALNKARELCSLRYGPVEAARKEFEKVTDEKTYDANVEWARFMRERDEFLETELYKLLPTTPPDCDCERCGGTGVVTTTFNQNSKWDWWEIGGRWHGMLENFWKNGSHNDVDVNVGSVTQLDLAKAPIPFAIVTPDGVWHALGNINGFARISKLDEDWDANARAILANHQDCIVAVVDCHV